MYCFNILFVSSGFRVRLRSPFSALHEFSGPSSTIEDDDGIEEARSDDVPMAESQMPRETLGDASEAFMVTGWSLLSPCIFFTAFQNWSHEFCKDQT